MLNLKNLKKLKKTKHQFENRAFGLKTRAEVLTGQKESILQQIAAIQSDSKIDANVEILSSVKAEVEAFYDILLEMKDNKTVMMYAAQLLKDSGIKAKIVKMFVPVINQLINKYLAALDFFVEFNLDEEFKETILSRYRDSFSYESFSEGEKMRLNLAILFAWRAIARLRSSLNCNVLIFDELLDGSLDNEGVADVLRHLGQLTDDDNVIVISHKEAQLMEDFQRLIRFEKVKNFSKAIIQEK